MINFFCFYFFCFLGLRSEAIGLRCFDLFAEHKYNTENNTAIASAAYYAEAIDALNLKYNKFIFKVSLVDILEPRFDNSPFWERTVMRYQSYKLRKILKNIAEHDQYKNHEIGSEVDMYNLENLAVKLEKLSFLNDESVTENMSQNEKIIYRQAQHSLLSQGLAQFLFSNSTLPAPSHLKNIYNRMMVPFKDVNLRWLYAPVYSPKLNGVVMPLEVIEKVVWQGYGQNKQLLEPYLAKTQAKYLFNIISSGYHWFLAGALAVGLGSLSYDSYVVYNHGQQAAVQVLTPTHIHSKKLAQTDYSQFEKNKYLENLIMEFKILKNREPTPDEIVLLKEIRTSKNRTQK